MRLSSRPLAVALSRGNPKACRDVVAPGIFLFPLLLGQAARSDMAVGAGLDFTSAANEFGPLGWRLRGRGLGNDRHQSYQRKDHLPLQSVTGESAVGEN